MSKRIFPLLIFMFLSLFPMHASARHALLAVKSVQPLANITVAYGTPFSSLNLPSSVQVTLSNNSTLPVTVRWYSILPKYNPNRASTYPLIGVLTMPQRVLNPFFLTARVNVIVSQMLTINSVSSLPDKSVNIGTDLSDVGLPTQVPVTLSNGTTANFDVTWDAGTPFYDKNVAGTYVFCGNFTLPSGITNPLNKKASAKVIVAPPTNPYIPNSDPNPFTGLNTSPGITLFEFDSLAEWSPSESVLMTRETNNVLSGTASVQWSALAPVSIQGTGESTISAMTSGMIGNKMASLENTELGIYVPDTNNISYILVRFYTDETFDDFFENAIGSWELSPGWNRLRRTKADYSFDATGGSGASPSWENISRMQIIVVFSDQSTPSITFDRMAINTSGRAKLLFTFDDAWYDVYKIAFPVFEQYGIKATTWAVKGLSVETYTDPDQKVFMDEADLNQLYIAGWDIGNHTVNHFDNINLLSDDDMKNEYVIAQNWLLSKGWERGAYHACYPSGSYNERLIELLKGIGVKSARTVDYGIQPTPVTNIYKLKTVAIGRDTDMDEIRQEIDRAVATGSSLFFMLHRVEASPEPDDGGTNYGQLAISTDNLKQIIEYADSYVKEQKLDITTISEWYEAYMRNY